MEVFAFGELPVLVSGGRGRLCQDDWLVSGVSLIGFATGFLNRLRAFIARDDLIRIRRSCCRIIGRLLHLCIGGDRLGGLFFRAAGCKRKQEKSTKSEY
jgi:hypothetical protein